jgi:hypothetical protein
MYDNNSSSGSNNYKPATSNYQDNWMEQQQAHWHGRW